MPEAAGQLLDRDELSVIAQPSRYWEQLNEQDAVTVRDGDFGNFKPRLATHYFQWTYRVRSLLRSEHVRFLLRRSTPAAVLRSMFGRGYRQPPDGQQMSGLDRWFDACVTRLVWAYAQRVDPTTGHLEEPDLGGPLPIFDGGRRVSQDLANSRIEWAAIKKAAGRYEFRSAIEIGAGYGRFAYLFLSLNPKAEYTIVDIEPALSVSRRYLSGLFPRANLRFLAPAEVNSLAGTHFDLGLSISSLQEMTPHQVSVYLRLLDRCVASGGIIYLKQWRDWHNPADDVDLAFRTYPLPLRWRTLHFGQCAIQTRFEEGVWEVPGRS